MSNPLLTIRLDPELRARMVKVLADHPYKPSITSVVERGLYLALNEIERLQDTIASLENERKAKEEGRIQ